MSRRSGCSAARWILKAGKYRSYTLEISDTIFKMEYSQGMGDYVIGVF
jgi:hypothetical protein